MSLEVITPLHQYYYLGLLNDMTEINDDGNCVDITTVDFAKAFGSISHNKLIYKLQFYGMCGKVQT